MTKEEFIGLIKKYKGQMYRFAFSIVKNETDAEDVVSETIRKAYENLNKLKNRRKFKQWIMSILSNEAKRMLSKRNREILTDTESAFENEYYMTDFELKQLVMSLPAEFREVVILYYYERFTIKEISQILEVSGGTVKSRLSRAREKLRLLL